MNDPRAAQPSPTLRCSVASLALLAAGGCGDGVDSTATSAEPAAERTEERPLSAEPVSGATPAYLLGTRIWDDTTTTSYFHVVPSIQAGTAVDPALALEVAGAAKLYSGPDGDWFAIGGGESPTITRYTLDARGALAKGESISLFNYGVTDLWDSLYFASPQKAYYPDTTGSQLIVWNPASMEVTGSIALPETVRDGYLTYYGLTPIQRGDDLIFSVGWFDWEENDSVIAETGLVVLDTRTDSVERFDLDARCGGVTQAIELASGDAYFVSSALAGAAYRVGRLATEPCALRVRRGAAAFDPDFALPLETLTGGAIAGEPAPAQGDELFLRVFDDSLASVEVDSRTWDLTGQAAWRWARWNSSTNELSMVEDLPPSTADVFWFRVDGKVFASETETDYSETTLIDLLAPEGSRRAVTVPGFLQNIARVR